MSAHGWSDHPEGGIVHVCGARILGSKTPWRDLAACVRDAEAHASCVPAPRYEECDDPERLAAHRAEHGPGSVEVECAEGWAATANGASVDLYWFCIDRDYRYRLVHPAPSTPAPPFEGAIPTDRGTWIASEGAGKVPTEGWEGRTFLKDDWLSSSDFNDDEIVEARPISEPERTVTVTLTEAQARALVVASGDSQTYDKNCADAESALLAALNPEDPS